MILIKNNHIIGFSIQLLWQILFLFTIFFLAFTVNALEKPEVKEISFELSPIPNSVEQFTRYGLKNYWFVLNKNGRPFSMEEEGEIFFEVSLLDFDETGFRKYIKTLALSMIPGGLTPNNTFFMLTQPRLYHLFLNESTFSTPNYNNSLSVDSVKKVLNLVDSTFMSVAVKLVLKVFDIAEWQKLMETYSKSDLFNQYTEDDFEEQSDFNNFLYGEDYSRICHVPSLYTMFIDSFGTSNVKSFWQVHRKTQLIAVLAQCSNIPVKVGITLVMSNGDGTGSSEYMSSKTIYTVFFIAYILLFLIVLLLILPCGCLYSSQNISRHSSPLREGSRRNSSNLNSENRNKISKNRGNNNTLEDSNLENEWDTEMNEENNNENGQSSKDYFCSILKKLKLSCCNHLMILYPTLQWIVLVCLIIRAFVCVLRIVEYKILSNSVLATPNNSIYILSLLLTVCTRSAIFAMQQFVCVGWGCAYKRPPTIKIIVASLVSITAFCIYVLSVTCDNQSLPTTFTAPNVLSNEKSVRCVTIGIGVRVCEILGSLLNIFQLTTLMATIGRTMASGVSRGHPKSFTDNTCLYLRYRGMCLPYTLGTLVPQIIFLIYAQLYMEFDDYHLEIAVEEFVQWYALTFVLLFLRKEPLFL